MPRKNKQIPHAPFAFKNHEAGKTRFPTKNEAQKAANYQMSIKPGLELYVYKSDIDNGWYLTRSHTSGGGSR